MTISITEQRSHKTKWMQDIVGQTAWGSWAWGAWGSWTHLGYQKLLSVREVTICAKFMVVCYWQLV